MQRSMSLFGCAALVAAAALSPRAHAGTVALTITESGGPAITITDNGALDSDPTFGSLSVNTALLNPSLVNFSFASLGAPPSISLSLSTR